MIKQIFCSSHLKSTVFRQTSTLSTDRTESISGALKRFYFKVHPDLFTQHPKEKEINEKSLQMVNAYLSSLQRKEQPDSVTVNFFTKQLDISLDPESMAFNSHRISLNSKNLLNCVNTILKAFSLPTVDVPKEEKQVRSHEIHFKVVDVGRQDDFTTIPKISIETWLISNSQIARSMNKRYQESLRNFDEKIDEIKRRFNLRSVNFRDDWSVPQFHACLHTFFTYIDKWHQRLLLLRDKRLIFGDKTCLLQDGSLLLGANDPPVYWDHVISFDLVESDQYMKKITEYEQNLSHFFRGIQLRHDPDSANFSRAHTYLYHLIHLAQHFDLNRDHNAHQQFLWNNFYLCINPFSSEPSITNSGMFQINAYDATIDILDFMIKNRDKALETKIKYENDLKTMNRLLQTLLIEFSLKEISTNPRIEKSQISECCQRLLDHRQQFQQILRKSRLKIDKFYNVAHNGTLSIPWDWSFDSSGI